MRIPGAEEASSLCVGRAGSVRPVSARPGRACALRLRSKPPGLRAPPAPARALARFPALTTAAPLLLSGATAAGPPLPDAARAAPATVARETELQRPATSPRGPEGAGSSESDSGLGGPGCGGGVGTEGGAGGWGRVSCAGDLTAAVRFWATCSESFQDQTFCAEVHIPQTCGGS